MVSLGLFGIMEVLVLGLGGTFMGLPPAERDAALIQSAPADALVYFEWASRGPGKAGAAGIEGLVADPEVQHFFDSLAAATQKISDSDDPTVPPAARQLPPLIFTLLNRSGCVFANFDPQKVQLKEGLGEPTPEMILQGLQAAVVVQGADAADEIAERLTALLTQIPEAEGKPLERQALPSPFPGATVLLHRHDNYFILSIGEGTLETVLAGLKGEAQGLLENERFQASLAKMPADRIASVNWLDIEGAFQKISAMMGPAGMMAQAMSKMIGLDALSSITGVTTIEDGQIVKQSFVETGGQTTGLMALVGGRPMTADDLTTVPADADMVAAFSLSLPKVFDEVEKIVAQTGQQPLLDATVENLETQIQLSLRDDILASLGDVWVVYNAPSTGGTFFTSPVLSLELRDGAQAADAVEKLMQVFGTMLRNQFQANGTRNSSRMRRGVVLGEFDFQEEHIYFVNTIGDDDVPFAPALCCTETHLLLAPHPQAIKAHLRFLSSDADRFKLPEAPAGDLLCYSTFDTKTLVRVLYGFAPYVGQAILTNVQRQGIELDVSIIPSAQAILPYVDRSHQFIVRTETGIHSRSVSSLPGSFGAAFLMQVPTFFLFSVRTAPVDAIEVLPMRAPAAPEAPAGPAVRGRVQAIVAPAAVKRADVKRKNLRLAPAQAP